MRFGFRDAWRLVRDLIVDTVRASCYAALELVENIRDADFDTD